VDASLAGLRARLFDYRAWNTSGDTLNNRVREALNQALAQFCFDCPEALVPDEESVALRAPVSGNTNNVKLEATSDDRVLRFVDTAGLALAHASSATTWRPVTDGTWDGIMHLEVNAGPNDRRRQAMEFWTDGALDWYVSIDRPWRNSTDDDMTFRIHQPEFFLRDDVIQLLQPARIYDDTRRQIWGIDTGGAFRQDMVGYKGQDNGRPERMWRGRHYQMLQPRVKPRLELLSAKQDIGGAGSAAPWAGPVQMGTWRVCYTFVRGKRMHEHQVAPEGLYDPVWESAPSPISDPIVQSEKTLNRIMMRAQNVAFELGYDVAGSTRETRTGYRIRFYVARDALLLGAGGSPNLVESAGLFYALAEIDPADPGTGLPTGAYVWNGSAQPDRMRPLRHSTGYYAWKTWPQQDASYQMDFRVLRLPPPYKHDSDTAPIQRDALPCLLELGLHYMSLLDGVDQASADLHKSRYNTMMQTFRGRYASPGKIIEPVPLGGHWNRTRYGRFSNSS